MAKFWLCAAVGLYVLPLCLAQISLNISCRYAGVFHVEKNRRYSLTREEAIELCKALNSTLPTWEQMTKAFSLGLETCRYGYIEEKIVVPRHNPYHLCAANTTGIYILQSNVSDRYDTYCFNSSEIRPRVCDPVTELYSSWPDNQSIIEISNADGTRYIGGSLYTEMPPFTDDDSSMGSGSANDRGTTDPNVIRSDVFHTSPSEDVHPTDDIASLSPDYTEDHNLNHDHDDQHPRNNNGSAEEVSTSEILKPATPTGWDTNEIKEQYASTTTVVSSSDVKHEDSTHDSLIHVVHPGWDNEVRYSANDTRDDVLPGTVSPGDGEHYSAAVSSSGSFLKQKVSTPHLQDGAHSGLETGGAFPVNTTTDDLHLVSSDEKDNNLEEETFHAAVFVNGSAKDEESHQDQLLSAGKPGRRRGGGSSTNRTSHGVVQILIPPSESDRENKSARTDSNQDQLAGGNDGSSSQNEHEQESSDSDELSNDVMKHEESTPNPLTHGMQWDSHEQYSTNTSSEETLPGIISPSENEHKNTSVYTVLDSIDGTEHEDVTNHPAVHDVEHEWSRKDEYPTNSTKDEERLAIFPLPDNNNEEKGFHTAVIHNNEAHHEDATQEPLPPVHHPDWHTEEEYSTNTSRDDILMGISANSGNEPDPLHPDEVSHGGTQDEDSTPEPVKLDSEDKYSTHSKEGVLPPGIVPRRGTNHKNNTYHAGLVPNQPEDRGSQQGDSTPKTQPRAAHIPDWLIVVASLLALALILGVCIAVNSRRRCGQKQKLVINNGKGVVDNKNMGGLNGEASKSHEMVHLVHKEQPEDQTGPHDEFLQIDETNNLQEVDLKSDVQAIHAIPVEPELAE